MNYLNHNHHNRNLQVSWVLSKHTWRVLLDAVEVSPRFPLLSREAHPQVLLMCIANGSQLHPYLKDWLELLGIALPNDPIEQVSPNILSQVSWKIVFPWTWVMISGWFKYYIYWACYFYYYYDDMIISYNSIHMIIS